MKIVYLHGFASSPQSRKAAYLGGKLQELGCEVEVPELDGGDFASLTITGQLEIARRCMGNDPCVLIGSSMGGYLAALLAARYEQVRKVVLMAPAFDFHQLWETELGDERLAEWKRNGTLSVFHYKAGRPVALNYTLMEDARQYEAFPDFRQPALILHGDRDDVVPVALSEQFVESHPNARVVVLPSGHELTDVLDGMWEQIQQFLHQDGADDCQNS